jgi:hypothetical protein
MKCVTIILKKNSPMREHPVPALAPKILLQYTDTKVDFSKR